MDDALGDTRRARRIDDVEGIARLRLEFGRLRACGRHPLGKFLVEHDPRHARKAILAQFAQLCAVDEDMLRARIARHARQLVGTGAGGQRRGHPARAHRGKEYQRIGNRGIAEDRHRLPPLQPVRDQPCGDPLDPLAKRGPAQLALVVAHRDLAVQRGGIGGDDVRKAAESFGQRCSLCLSHAAHPIAARGAV